jgi:hypothetical protein
MSLVKRNYGKIDKSAHPTVRYAGEPSDMFMFPAQLKPTNRRLMDMGVPPPPSTYGIPLYCNQRGNEDRLFKAPIEDFKMRLPGKALADESHLSFDELVRMKEPAIMEKNQYVFDKGIKSDGGRPLFSSAL